MQGGPKNENESVGGKPETSEASPLLGKTKMCAFRQNCAHRVGASSRPGSGIGGVDKTFPGILRGSLHLARSCRPLPLSF